ncbi:MAG: polysaccharide biosynthesis protein [Lachnospiraceae bacterium]|nr:polysaccharide biosynthesis protein [Lachnospiraceae bacterium]
MPSNKKNDGLIMQAGILASAGIIVRIIGLLYNTPLVAIIGDEGFGYYNNAYNAYSIILLISSYSIPSAVSKVIAQRLATKEYRNAHRIFCCAFIYVLVVGSIASLFVFFGAGLLVEMESAILPLKVLAPTIFFSGILGVLRGYFQAHRSMAQTSVSQILEQIINALVSVLAAYLLVKLATGKDASTVASYGAVGGTIGTGAGVLSALLFMVGMYALNKKTIKRRIERDTTHEDESYKDIFKMIIMVVTPFILSTGIYNINNFLDNTIYSQVMMNTRGWAEAEVATGLSAVSKATKIANIPIALASAMATALIPGISSDFAKKDFAGAREKVAKSVKVTMLIAIPAAVGLGVLAKPIMKVIFHQPESLDLSSALLSMLAVSVVLYSLSTLTQAVLQSVGRMNIPIINAAVSIVIHAVVMVVMMRYLNEEYSLYYYILTTVLYALLLCVFNGISVRRSIDYRQEVKKTFLLPALAAAVMGAAAFGVYQGLYYLIKINIIALFVAIGIACMIYFVLIIKLGAVTESELRSMPKGHLLVKAAKKLKLIRENSDTEALKRNTAKVKENTKFQEQIINKRKVTTDESLHADDGDYWLDE